MGLSDFKCTMPHHAPSSQLHGCKFKSSRGSWPAQELPPTLHRADLLSIDADVYKLLHKIWQAGTGEVSATGSRQQLGRACSSFRAVRLAMAARRHPKRQFLLARYITGRCVTCEVGRRPAVVLSNAGVAGGTDRKCRGKACGGQAT